MKWIARLSPSVLMAGLTLISVIAPGQAAEDAFKTGPVFRDYGSHAPVPDAMPLPEDIHMKMALDVTEAAEDGKHNSNFETAAHFINLWHANGVPLDRIDVALVVHGGAYKDLLVDGAFGGSNPSADLVTQLLEHGVQIIYCGQAAVGRDVATEDLIPGVTLSLSASTAHAVLQLQGYAVRPY